MKVVNIPSTKMMKNFCASAREARYIALRVPIHAIVLNVQSSLRAQRSNPSRGITDGWIASLRSQ
jgi:hypothetical protein